MRRFLLFACLLAGSLGLCGGCAKIDRLTADKSADAGDEVWLDARTGLTWQVAPTGYLHTWADATDYCAHLSLGEREDWRLPTISELRSLLTGCDATETGGSCGNTDVCLDSTCRDASCAGCAVNGGPGPGGMYWPPELRGDCCVYWSSSLVADAQGLAAWYVHAPSAHIDSDYIEYEFYARCVRFSREAQP